MTENAMIEIILNGPVHCFRNKDSTFWFTEGMNDNYICHDLVKGEWTVHSYGYLGTGKTLALAYESVFLNTTENWNVD